MRLSSLVLNVGLACVMTGSLMSAQANDSKIETVSASNVVFLQEGYLVSRVQSELHRFNTSMIKLRYTDNRDLFLINRDELWNSREELSFALSNLEDYISAPNKADDAEIVESIRMLLTESEVYANDQNMLISARNKSDDGCHEILGVLTALKKQEQVLASSVTSEQQVAFEDMSISRDVLENMFATFFATDEILELQGMAKQIEGSIGDYVAKLETVALDFPELSDNQSKLKRLTKNFFDSKNIGGFYFVYKQKLDSQRQLESKFDRKFKVILRDLSKLDAKLKMRIGF